MFGPLQMIREGVAITILRCYDTGNTDTLDYEAFYKNYCSILTFMGTFSYSFLFRDLPGVATTADTSIPLLFICQ